MNHFRFHIGDYLKDTTHLSLVEHGVYLRLIQVYYTREQAIPEDQVARLIGARSQDERDALTAVLKEFFEVVDGNCHQKRCQGEIDEWHRLSAEQAAKGRAGAAKRWNGARNGNGHAGEMASATASDSNGHVPAIISDGRTIASNSQLPTTSSKRGVSAPRTKVLTPGASPPKTPRGSSRVPEDFLPDVTYARTELPDLDVPREIQKFRDWEFKTPRKDWAAAWRNWVRRCRDTGHYARIARPGGGDNGLPTLVA